MGKYKKISKVLWLILGANLFVAITKMVLGSLFKVNSLTADGFHSLTDSTSNIIGLIGIKLASKPADKNHPYGYHKFETITGLMIGFMLFVITIRIVYGAIMWFISPVTPEINLFSQVALFITVLINIIVAKYEYQKGTTLQSDVLISDSIHTKTDVFISLGVLISLILIKLGVPPIIDPILSLLIAIFVFHSVYEILKTTTGILLDKKAVDEKRIIEIILNQEKDILDIHKIRSRGRKDHIYIDLHVLVDPLKTVKEAHDISHRIEEKLNQKLNIKVELIAHIEPYEDNHKN